MKRIILTGGGTAGHVMPNIALLPSLEKEGYEAFYIGAYDEMEKDLVPGYGIPYFGISAGKWRRFRSAKNLLTPFKVLKGIGQARKIMKDIHPNVVFSKGGFVSVPVVLAAKSLGIPAIVHESDITSGLANKISTPFATKVCCTFAETVNEFPQGKALLTGSPIREELLHGDKEKAKKFVGFTDNKPVILVMGGSLGAVAVNDAVRGILDDLLKTFNIIHICGEDKTDAKYNNIKGYIQYEYVKDELKDIFALSDIIISRAGANAICEILALQKPNILIPLPKKISRGDQLLNAESFRKLGYSDVLDEETITNEVMYQAIMNLYQNKEKYIEKMRKSEQNNAVNIIIDLIKKESK